MEKLVITTMDKLEQLEKNKGVVGTVIGLILITLVIGTSIFGIATIMKYSVKLINIICIRYFGFRLY
jgi:hypothetical protein